MEGDVYPGGVAWGIYHASGHTWMVQVGERDCTWSADIAEAARFFTPIAAAEVLDSFPWPVLYQCEIRPVPKGAAIIPTEVIMVTERGGPHPPPKVPDKKQRQEPAQQQQQQQAQQGQGQQPEKRQWGGAPQGEAHALASLPPFVLALLAAGIAFLQSLASGQCCPDEDWCRQMAESMKSAAEGEAEE